MKKQILIIGMIALVFCFTGCGQVPKLKNGEEAVVTFDKKSNSIPVDELYNEVKDKYGLSVLLDMIDKKLLEQDYPSDDEEKEEVQNNLEQIKSTYESYYKSYYSSFQEFISASYGVSSEEEFKDYLALQYKKDQLTNDYAKKQVKDSDIKKYYDEKTIGDMKASHILIKPAVKDSMSASEKQEAENAALEKAKEVITKLDKGEKLKDLAKKYSDDETVDLGWFNRGDMVDAFEEACINLKKNEYSKTPVKTEYGYHVILKTGQKAKPKLKEVKNSIIETLANDIKSDDAAIGYVALKEYRKEKGIKFEDSSLNRSYKSYIEQQITNARKNAAEQDKTK